MQRYYNTRKGRLSANNNTSFYLSVDIKLYSKFQMYSYKLSYKLDSGFLKKKNTINRWVLFRLGSRGWKNSPLKRDDWVYNSSSSLTNLRGGNKIFLLNDKETKLRVSRKDLNLKLRFNRVFFENRKILRQLFKKKRFRQRRFNNRFSDLMKKDYTYALYSLELSLQNILVRSKFFYLPSQVIEALRLGLIFLNGSNLTKANKLVNVGDVVQLIICKFFFLNYRRVFSEINKFKKYLSFKVWSMTKNLDNLYKQKPTYITDKVCVLINFYFDVPRFLQVEYSTLSIVVIYKPLFFKDFSYLNRFFLNGSLLRLYNWKYIS